MRKYKQLALGERYHIYALKKEGFNQSQIAERVGVHRSTISRELRRNVRKRRIRRSASRPQLADRLAMARRSVARRPTVMTRKVRGLVKCYLQRDWSPEQISGWFKLTGRPSVSHETIYRHVWQDKALGGGLYRHLRRRKKYHKRGGGGRPISGRVSIDERPAVVDERSRIGDWEVDTVLPGRHKGAIVTIAERRSRYVFIGKVERKASYPTARCIIELLQECQSKVLTITADNGAEFACHKMFGKRLGADVYFAHPYKPWERGLNENTNGLIRQYLPKGMPFDNVTPADLRAIMEKLNTRPRKCLGYRTPRQVFWGTDVALEG